MNKILIFFYSIASLLGEIGQNIWLPLLLDSTNLITKSQKGQDIGTYGIIIIQSITIFVIYLILYLLFSRKKYLYTWKIINASILYFISTFMTAYTSNSFRNSPTTQVLLSNLTIPIVAFIRLFWFGKIPTLKKSICIMIISVGFFISIVPNIFLSKSKDKNKNLIRLSQSENILWSFNFIIFSVIMSSIVNVYVENILKESKIQAELSYISIEASDRVSQRDFFIVQNQPIDVISLRFAMSIFSLGFPLLFWVDIIPNVGYSKDIDNFWKNIFNTIICTFSLDFCKRETLYFAIFFVVSIILSNVGGGFLIKESEGSLFWGLINNLSNPLSILFWILFQPNPLKFHPEFKFEHIYIVIGLLITLLPLIIYATDDHELLIEWVDSEYTIIGIKIPKFRIIDDEDMNEVFI